MNSENIWIVFLKENLIQVILIILVFLGIGFLISTTAPTEINDEILVTVEQGETIKGVSKILKESGVIRSRTAFNTIMVLSGNNVIEGDYLFYKPVSLFEVIDKISSGNYETLIKKITLFEGMTIDEMSKQIVKIFPNFDVNEFIKLTEGLEGYLFPDTYEFRENVSPEIVIETMQNNFNAKILEINHIIESSPNTLEEIIIMASIVEKEATRNTQQEVSDVFWKRISIGMPIQADATFKYFVGKGTFDLTLEDLGEDHPYNSYQNNGLTPTPISNPGLSSIIAAANPQPTPYLYFLTGRDGNMYFAKTFDGHKTNRALYLD